MSNGAMRIGEVARQAGVRTSLIRDYERIGLLPAAERTREQRISMCDVVGSWTPAGAISSITPP